MSRRAQRDAGLVLRIVLVLLLLVATCAAIAAGFLWLFRLRESWWPYWTLLAILLAATGILQYRRTESVLLRAVGARVLDPRAERQLHALVERVAAMFDLPPPRLALSRSPIPNGFTIGMRRGRAVVVLTEGLRRRVEPDELEAVVAHELAHLANRDAAVMSVAGVPRSVGYELWDSPALLSGWFFLWPVGLLIYGWGSLLTLALSRYREYAADAGSALATGRPEALMSALQKLTGEIGLIPREDLRAVRRAEPLFIVPVLARPRGLELLADHPPLEKRLARLATIAREMGKVS